MSCSYIEQNHGRMWNTIRSFYTQPGNNRSKECTLHRSIAIERYVACHHHATRKAVLMSANPCDTVGLSAFRIRGGGKKASTVTLSRKNKPHTVTPSRLPVVCGEGHEINSTKTFNNKQSVYYYLSLSSSTKINPEQECLFREYAIHQ